MKKSELKQIIQEVIKEVGDESWSRGQWPPKNNQPFKPEAKLGGIPVHFSFSEDHNWWHINIYNSSPDTHETSKGQHFYKEEADAVVKDLKRKIRNVDVKYVKMGEYYVDQTKSSKVGYQHNSNSPTGKEVMWIVIQNAKEIFHKLFVELLKR